MKKDTSIFDIFQDPLLTIVALILLGTVWIIIPRADEGADRVAEHQIQLDKLKCSLDALDQRMAELMDRLRQLTATLHGLNSSEQEAGSKAKQASRKVDDLLKQVAVLKSDIKVKNDELQSLERRIKEARQVSQKAAQEDELDRKIRRLKEEIAGKEALLKELERQAGNAEQDVQKQKTATAEQKAAIDDLQRQLAGEKKELARLEAEKTKLDATLKNITGFGEYVSVGSRSPILFDLSDQRVLEINDKNYNFRTWMEQAGRRIVQVVEATKKRPASGETAEQIETAGSDFQRLLASSNKEKKYVVFLLRKDCFSLFHRARTVAKKYGFLVDWQPRNDGPLSGVVGSSPEDYRAR